MIDGSYNPETEQTTLLLHKRERLQQLQKPRSPGVSKLIPKKALDRLKTLANDRRLIEYETLNIEGDLDETMMEYVMQLPEYHEILRRLHDLVDELLLFINPQIPKLVRKVFAKPGEVNVWPIIELFRDIHRVMYPLAVASSEFNFINNTVAQLEDCAVASIMSQVRRETAKRAHEAPPRSPEEIKVFYEILARIYAQATRGRNLPDANTVPLFDDLISKKQKEQFEKLTNDPEERQKTNQQLAAEAEEKFRLIRETEPLHDFDVAESTARGSKIRIAGLKESLSANERSAIIYTGRIILHPEHRDKYAFPIISTNEAGIAVITCAVNAGRFFDFIIKPYTSEIFFTHSLPLNKILKGRAYLVLKNVIFDAILDCLTRDEKQLAQVAQTVTETRKSIPPAAPELLDEEAPKEMLEPDDFFCKRALRGQKGNRVLRALINLLGEPRNSGSSHYIFTCRNGKSYPIAIHGDKDVGIGMLLTSLKHFGISPRELYEQL